MNRKIWILLLVTVPLLTSAQRWKRYRYEAIGAVGVSNFLGELGGANQIGTNYFRDLEISTTRPAVMVGFRYKLNLYMALKTALAYGSVSGNDKLTKERARSHRNLHFKSPIYEFSVQYEFSWMKEKVGHRYRLRGVRGQRNVEIFTYGILGLGGFYYNPKARWEGDGNWHALQPLGTEGQGILATRKKYSRFSVAIPMGIGFRYALGRNVSVGVEFVIRKTFTDYIDDASTTYYHNQLIRDQNGDVAADLADPSVPTDPDQWRWTAAGQQRGDPTDKDSYMFALFSVNYKLRTSRGNLPKF